MSVKHISAAALALSGLALSAMPAQATSLTYTISGTGSGSLGATSFTNAAYTFTLIGDSANFNGQAVDPLTTAEFNIAGIGSGTISIATRLGEAGAGVIYFSRAGSSGADLEDFITPGENLLSSFGPVTGTGVFALNQFDGVATSGGALTLNSSSDVAFSGSAAAVPEPATWCLMLAGFGMVGFALRQRARTTVAYS